jgi:hypothetical protein
MMLPPRWPLRGSLCGGLLGWEDQLVASVTHTDPLEFTQLLLTLIDEGRRTATYKLAVLLALIDCCAVASDSDGVLRGPDCHAGTRATGGRVVLAASATYAVEGTDRLRESSKPRAISADAVAVLEPRLPEHRRWMRPSAPLRTRPQNVSTSSS